jgi:hypothetical protein
MTYFEEIRRRMPHFFSGVSVLEYVPHSKCKSVEYLFDDNCNYIVLNPETNDLSGVQMESFKVAMSVNRFQYIDNYIEEFTRLHRIASKFVMFSCAGAGAPPRGQLMNLTESDFTTALDLDSMFETYVFFIDYNDCTLYFWGVKKNGV